MKKRRTALLLTGMLLMSMGASVTVTAEETSKDELVIAVGDMTDGTYDACMGSTMYGTDIFYSSLLKVNK